MTLTTETLTKDKIKEIIAKRIAKEFKNNDIVTLGIGLPTEAALLYLSWFTAIIGAHSLMP